MCLLPFWFPHPVYEVCERGDLVASFFCRARATTKNIVNFLFLRKFLFFVVALALKFIVLLSLLLKFICSTFSYISLGGYTP